MSMSDEQISALAGFEGRNPEDQAAIARKCMELAAARLQIKTLREAADSVCKSLEHPTESVNALQMWKLRDAIDEIKGEQK